jgi:acyl-CoA dehydrogenase
MESCRGTGKEALREFDKAFFAHGGYIISNFVRSFIFGLTNGRGISTTKRYKRHQQKISRYCAVLGLLSDIAMGILGGKLKRMERLSERMGAVVGHLYAASSVLHFANNHPELDCEDFVTWSIETLISETKKNIVSFLHNFPNHVLGRFLRFWIFPLGLQLKKPSDALEAKLAMALQTDSSVRNQLIDILYHKASPKNPIGGFDETLKQLHVLAPLEKKLKRAIKEKTIRGHHFEQYVADAVAKNLLTHEEGQKLLALDERRMRIINVDDFSDSELKKRVSH